MCGLNFKNGGQRCWKPLASRATHHAPDQAAFGACPLKQPTLASLLICLRFYPPSAFQATGLHRFYLPLIADFWGRILVRPDSCLYPYLLVLTRSFLRWLYSSCGSPMKRGEPISMHWAVLDVYANVSLNFKMQKLRSSKRRTLHKLQKHSWIPNPSAMSLSPLQRNHKDFSI